MFIKKGEIICSRLNGGGGEGQSLGDMSPYKSMFFTATLSLHRDPF